jgi:hypothetical protein
MTLRPDWNGPTTYITIGAAAARLTMKGYIVASKIRRLIGVHCPSTEHHSLDCIFCLDAAKISFPAQIGDQNHGFY